MSLGQATLPIVRPLAPSRSRRHSQMTMSFGRSPDGGKAVKPFQGVVLQGGGGVNGVLGGLREKSEEELGRASRDELERALRDAWARQDELVSEVEDGKRLERQVDDQRSQLEAALEAASTRLADALMEQRYLEGDVEERDQLLERLGGRLADSERQCREIAKRAMEQEKAFEAERAALQNQEAHLQRRLCALEDTRPPRHQNGLVPSQALDQVREELATLSVSHSTLLATINTLTTEMKELKAANRSLAEENEGWEFLVRQQTISGRMTSVSGVSTLFEVDGQGESMDDGREKSMLERLDEEMDRDLDGAEECTEDCGGLPSSPPETVAVKGQPGERVPTMKGESSGELTVAGCGINLAAELGRAEVDLEGGEWRNSSRGDTGQGNPPLRISTDSYIALAAEVAKLREENKALQLYCSKILDRIIAQEGFEHILSVDYKTRRVSGTSHRSLNNVDFEASSVSRVEGNGASGDKEQLKPRPVSMVSRVIGSASEETGATPDAKIQKKAKRGFSIDFRSLGFGLSSASSLHADPQSDPALKPLVLASRAPTSMGSASTSSTRQHGGFVLLGWPPTKAWAPTASLSRARRLEKEDEDGNDKRERHGLEAALKLMGMNEAGPVSTSSTKRQHSPPRPVRKPTKFSRSPTREEKRPLAAVSPPLPQNLRLGTPLSRLSSALSSVEDEFPPSPLSPVSQSNIHVSPEEAAEAAFKDFDLREKEAVKALDSGRGGGYTSPKGSVLAARASRRQSGSGLGEGGWQHWLA